MMFCCRRLARVLALTCATATAASAQIVSIPDDNAAIGAANLVPLGSNAVQDLRTQILVPASYLPTNPARVVDLAFASAGVGDYRFTSIEIRVGHLDAARNGTLSARFADNTKDASLVLSKTASWRYDWPKADAWHRVGFSAEFRHDGVRDLVVDILVRGAAFNGASPGPRRSSSLETVYALRADATSGHGPFTSGAKLQLVLSNGSLVYVGSGCPASNKKTPLLELGTPPSLGGSSKALVRELAASAATILFFGTSDQAYGSLKLPFDLGALGAPSCTLRTDVLLVFPGVADAAGKTEFALQFPSDTRYRGATVAMQALVLDASANSLGLVVSRLAKATL